MKYKYFLSLSLMAFNAYALDLKTMTPVNCQYTGANGKQVSAKLECGNFKICNAAAACTYVDNKVFKAEFNGDQNKAAEAAATWFGSSSLTALPRAVVAGSKYAWSELSGKNPKYLTMDMSTYCATKGDQCPDALTCLLDQQIPDVKDFNPDALVPVPQQQEKSGAAK